MTDAKTILKMIETVAPDDTEKLKEIEILFWSWYLGIPIDDIYVDYDGDISFQYDGKHQDHNFLPSSTPYHLVTRSRDALKAIRPEGWGFKIETPGRCVAVNYSKPLGYVTWATTEMVDLLTEELAELHTIVQAIEYERTT